MPDILALISAHTETPRTVEPGTLLADILRDELDRHTLALEIEELTGREIGDVEMEGWVSVADVLASVKGAAR